MKISSDGIQNFDELVTPTLKQTFCVWLPQTHTVLYFLGWNLAWRFCRCWSNPSGLPNMSSDSDPTFGICLSLTICASLQPSSMLRVLYGDSALRFWRELSLEWTLAELAELVSLPVDHVTNGPCGPSKSLPRGWPFLWLADLLGQVTWQADDDITGTTLGTSTSKLPWMFWILLGNDSHRSCIDSGMASRRGLAFSRPGFSADAIFVTLPSTAACRISCWNFLFLSSFRRTFSSPPRWK